MKLFMYLVALLAVAGVFCYVIASGGDHPSTGTMIAFVVLIIVGLTLLRKAKMAARDLGRETVSTAVENRRARKDAQEGTSQREYERRLTDPEFTKEQAQQMLAAKPKGFDQVMSKFEDNSDS